MQLSRPLKVIHEEQRLKLLGFQDSIQKRKYSTDSGRSILKKPDNLSSIEDVFDSLETFLNVFIDSNSRKENMLMVVDNIKENQQVDTDDTEDPYESFFQVGSKVKVYWKREEVKELGLRGGWYVASVKDFCREEDQISVHFVSEPDSIYAIEVTSIEDKTLIIC